MRVNKKEYNLVMILGPMWSFKTTNLINYIKELKDKGNRVFVFAPKGSQRVDRPFLREAFDLDWDYNTNPPKEQDASILGTRTRDTVSTKSFLDKLNLMDLEKGDWIVIDEIHFFNADIVKELKRLSKSYNLLIAGLDKNYTSRIFETPHMISKFATQLIFLKSLCKECKEPAEFYDKKPNKMEGIGGADIYAPKCYKHVNIKTKSNLW